MDAKSCFEPSSPTAQIAFGFDRFMNYMRDPFRRRNQALLGQRHTCSGRLIVGNLRVAREESFGSAEWTAVLLWSCVTRQTLEGDRGRATGRLSLHNLIKGSRLSA